MKKLNEKGIDTSLCPASRQCSYERYCTLSEIHLNCGMFRRIILEKLGMEDFPLGADMQYYKDKAFPLKN